MLKPTPSKKVLSLIDFKTNRGIKEVINHIDSFKTEIKAEIKALKWMFGALSILITLATKIATIFSIHLF